MVVLRNATDPAYLRDYRRHLEAYVIGLRNGSLDGGTTWDVAPSNALNDCVGGDYLGSYSNPGPLGDAPTGPEYNRGWLEHRDHGFHHAPITVTAGDGSATGGGGGGGGGGH